MTRHFLPRYSVLPIFDGTTRLAASACCLLTALLFLCPPAFAGRDRNSSHGKSGALPTVPESKSAFSVVEDSEVKMGREAAEDNDSHVLLVTDAALVKRVNKIGQEIAGAANTFPIPASYGSSQLKKFHYTFKVVKDKNVNAYSLPGGYVYVNSGLLDFIHSDDELAGVLAHEISHALHHHVVKLMHEQNKMQSVFLPAIVGLVLARARATDIANAAIGGQLYTQAKSSGYSVEAEKDADHTGILLLTHTSYNPTGLYSFMLRLAAKDQKGPQFDLGIYQDHPPTPERVEAAKHLLDSLHIPIQLNRVDPNLNFSVEMEKIQDKEPEQANLKMCGITLCHYHAIGNQTGMQRAQDIANHLNATLENDVLPFEIRLNREQNKIVLRGITLMTQQDAEDQKTTLTTLSKQISDALLQIRQKRQLESAF